MPSLPAAAPAHAARVPQPGREPPPLRLCFDCRQFVVPGPAACRFCGADLDAAAARHAADLAAVHAAADRLRALLDRARADALSGARSDSESA